MPKQTYQKKPYDEWKREKEAETKAILSELEQGVKDVFSSGKYQEYLDTMSKFHNYSTGNIWRILKQMPDASLVAGFNDWREKHGRYVKKGETALRISAPRFKEVAKTNDKGEPLIGADGKIITEKKLDYFVHTSVFDVSQTDGKPLPEIATVLTGEIDNFNALKTSLEKISPVPVGYENIGGETHGYYSHAEKRIAIQENLSQRQTLKTLVHEITHSVLHDKQTGELSAENRRTKEVQAESVAYVVCKKFGIDSSDYSFGYIAGWSENKDYKELKASLDIIGKTANKIIGDIEKELTAQLENIKKEEDLKLENAKKIEDLQNAEYQKNQKNDGYNNYQLQKNQPKPPSEWAQKCEQARGANLAEFFSRGGFKVEKKGNELHVRGYGGLYINTQNNQWHCFSQDTEKGNSVDCLVKICGYDFKSAVEILSGGIYFSAQKNQTHNEPERKIFKPPERETNSKRAFAYLCQTRKIPAKIVEEFLKAGKLYQEKKTGNIVFPHFKNGVMVGAEKHGTLSNSEQRFKGVAAGTYDSVFSVTFSKEIKKAYIFESAIDLMSFYALSQGRENFAENGVALVSMAGLKPNVIKNIQANGIKIISCVDNEPKGQKFNEENGFESCGNILADNNVKDWNELLQKVYELENPQQNQEFIHAKNVYPDIENYEDMDIVED